MRPATAHERRISRRLEARGLSNLGEALCKLKGARFGGCYEIDGGNAAAQLARESGAAEERARAIYDVIALHNDEVLPPDAATEVVLLWDSAGTDVTGNRYADVRPAIIPELLGAYPRLDFKRAFTALLVDQASRKPKCPAVEMIAAGILEEIAQAPFES